MATLDMRDASSKWLASTKKAAWTLSTTFIVLVVPLILSMDRESASEEAANAMHALTGSDKKA
jgi:hypothetical protein